MASVLHVVGIDPPLQVALAEFLLELHDVLPKAVQPLQLAGLEVALDVLLVDLVDGEFAEIIFGAAEILLAVLLIEVVESVGPEFLLVDGMLVALIKDVVEYSFSLDVEA